jgi:long-chain acyl-CoA synthetase
VAGPRIENGRVYIVGRLKEILVLSTAEKIAPGDLEMAITADPLFDQAMVVGEGRPYLGALVVLNGEPGPLSRTRSACIPGRRTRSLRPRSPRPF